MDFDPTLRSNSEGLPPHLAAAKDRLFYSRRPLGLNVQFIREDGLRDEWSFADVSRRDNFVASLVRRGVPHAVSH